MIQTLIGSHQTGNLGGDPGGRQAASIAEIFFFKGNIARAKFRQLTGDDAVFQLFQTPLEGEFSFTGRNVPEEEVQADITMPAISLLMESVRLQDELPLLQARVPDPERALSRQKAAQLQWDEADTVELAAVGLGAAQEGRLADGPAARDPALLVRDLQDAGHADRGGADRVGPAFLTAAADGRARARARPTGHGGATARATDGHGNGHGNGRRRRDRPCAAGVPAAFLICSRRHAGCFGPLQL